MQVARAENRGTQWTIREQLILGSAVQRSGDQNWVSVSRTIRPLSEEDRQPEFYSQKNCALNYAALLDNASTPKRKKKRGSESDSGETTQDLIVRDLTEKRLVEINNLLEATRIEYNGIKKDLEMIENGEISDEDIMKMWNKVKDEEKDMVAMEQASHHDEGVESIGDQSSDVMTTPPRPSDKPSLPLPLPLSNKPALPAASKLPDVTETTLKSNAATPLIATPIVTPMSTSATTIKIEPNTAMEALGAAKPVQVKVLSHDDHTYSSPGPPNLVSTPEVANDMIPSSDRITPTTPPSTISIVSQDAMTISQVTSKHDQDTTTVDQAAVPVVDQAPSKVIQDQAINVSPDQHASTIDDRTAVDQASSTDDKVTDEATPAVKEPDTPTEKPTTPTEKHATEWQAVSTEKQATPAEKQAATVEKQVTTVEKPTEKQATPTDKQATPSEKLVTPNIVVTPTDEQATPAKEQGTLSKEQVTPTKEEVPTIKEEVTSSNEQVTPSQQATPVSEHPSPTTATEQAATPTTEKTMPTSKQVTPTVGEVTPSTDVDIEKKTRTRGSSRISSKIKVPQGGRKRASSPRTMVIIGKQSMVDSDGEDVQVRHKGPPRRLHRLLSNEPSESEEEPLSAVTSGMTSPSSSMIDDVDPEVALSMKMWRKSIMLVWQHASQHKFASLFLHAVKDEEATGYSEVVFRPMDLSLIKKKIETGLIRTDLEFQRDMLLMFQNALMYNSSNHDVYMMAEEMRKDVMENIQDYLATQLMVHSTAPAKILRSRDSSRKMDHMMALVGMGDDSIKDEDTPTPLRKTRHRLPSDDSISSSGTPAAKKLRTKDD